MSHLIIGTAGHVDHGKTALVKALTNIDCDTHKEEKERGITINLGFAHLDLSTGDSVGIVDVPGHKDFIRTMVAGAYGIDIAMLVVAADSGIMPQTEEHLRILEMLGVEHGIIAITKADLVDNETLELAELEITEYLEGSKLERSPVIAVSSLTGQGTEKLLQTIADLIPLVREKEAGSMFRMYIDRIFNVKGLGYVVTGTVLEGSIRTGQDLLLLPGKGKKVKVRNIERHGKQVDAVFRGDRAALNLAGLKTEDFTRGMVLCNKQLDDTEMIDATVKIFDPTSQLPVWSNVMFFSGTFETSARMHLLDKDELLPGDSGLVQLHLAKPAILSVKDKFILRNSSNDKTLGGGTIFDVKPLHHRKRTETLIQNLLDLSEATLHSDSLVNRVKIELNKLNGPVFASTIAALFDKPPESLLEELMAAAPGELNIFESGGQHILITSALDKHYKKQVIDELESYHQKFPILDEGLETNEFTGKFCFGKNEAGKLYLENLMKKLHEAGHVRRSGTTWVLPGHQVQIDGKTQAELDWLENLFRISGMDIPNYRDIEQGIHDRKITKDRYKMFLKHLSSKGILIYYDGVYIHRNIVEEVQNQLLKKIAVKTDGINEKEFRELAGATRRFIQVVLGIFIEKEIISKPTFYILITDKGREILEHNTKK